MSVDDNSSEPYIRKSYEATFGLSRKEHCDGLVMKAVDAGKVRGSNTAQMGVPGWGHLTCLSWGTPGHDLRV